MRHDPGQSMLQTTRPAWNRRGPWVLVLAWTALSATALGSDARRDAQDIQARNVLRACLTALETLQLEQSDRLQALNGHSCLDVPGLSLHGLTPATFPPSRVTLHPEAQEGVQVRVTSETGKVFIAPAALTPRPATAADASPLPRWVSLTLCLLSAGLLVTLLSFIPPVASLAWAAGPLLLLGSWFLWTVARYPPTDDGPAQVMFLLYWNTWTWLLLGAGTGTLRRVRHAGRESWAASLGAGLLWSLLPSSVLTFTVLGALSGVADFEPRLTVLLLLALLLLTLLAWGQRLFPARPSRLHRGAP